MGSPGPLVFSLFVILLLHLARTEFPSKNFSCILGGSFDLQLQNLNTGSFNHLLLWSASKRKGLVLWVPGDPPFVVSPQYSGRITLLENKSFRIQNLNQLDSGIYEVVMRNPGTANKILLEEYTHSVFNLSIVKDPQGNHSCSLVLPCLSCMAPRVPGHVLLLSYWAAKAVLTPLPLFLFYYFCLKREAAGTQGQEEAAKEEEEEEEGTLPASAADPEALSEV